MTPGFLAQTTSAPGEQVNPATGLRLPRGDEIEYTLVGPQESVGIRVPDLLTSPFMRLVGSLPKSGIQVIAPLDYLHGGIVKNEPLPVRFGIVFEQNFKVCTANNHSLIRTFFWASTHREAIDALKTLSGCICVFPATAAIANLLKENGVDSSWFVENGDDFLARVRRIVVNELGITETELCERRKEVDDLVTSLHSEELPRTALPFAPAHVNLRQFQQIFGQFGDDYWQDSTENDHTRRAAFLSSSFTAVADALVRCCGFDVNGEKRHAQLPSAILAFPSISPLLKRLLKRAAGDAPADMRSALKVAASVRFAEQDSRTYDCAIQLDGNSTPSLALEFGVSESARYTRYLDAVAYLHGSFHCAPYLRLPMKGDSLTKLHSRFAPSSFSDLASNSSTHRLIKRFSSKLGEAMAPELLSAIDSYPGGFVALSDLPVEWINFGGVPFCFIRDVCRLPETVPSNLMSQFSRNRHTRYQVTADTPKKTLIICGAPLNDRITQNFAAMGKIWQEHSAPWRWLHCESIAQLLREVNDFRPELLVFDTHGRFQHNNAGSELQIGSEWLTGEIVVAQFPQIPLVLLSTCWGAPLYGCPNTIAHAFFEAGSLSVVTSMLPVNVFKGGVLYTRILNNLVFSTKTSVHHNWSAFVSHNLRTSHFDDMQARVLRYFKSLLSEDEYIERRAKWQLKAMRSPTRAEAFKETAKVLTECFEPHARRRISDILAKEDYVPEFMYYSVMGRADLVQFKVWNEANHEPNPLENTLSDLTNSGAPE